MSNSPATNEHSAHVSREGHHDEAATRGTTGKASTRHTNSDSIAGTPDPPGLSAIRNSAELGSPSAGCTLC